MLGLKKQWPFWISGIFVGVAEIMNYIVLEKPIRLTTGLLVWSIKRGMRLTGFSFRGLMMHANDELSIKYFERYQKTYDGEDKGHVKEAGKPGLGDAVTEGD